MTNIIITSLYGAPVHQDKKQTINCNECILRYGSSFITNLFPPLSLGTSTVTLHTWIRIARSFASYLKCLLILFAAPLADTHISGSVASRRRLIWGSYTQTFSAHLLLLLLLRWLRTGWLVVGVSSVGHGPPSLMRQLMLILDCDNCEDLAFANIKLKGIALRDDAAGATLRILLCQRGW